MPPVSLTCFQATSATTADAVENSSNHGGDIALSLNYQFAKMWLLRAQQAKQGTQAEPYSISCESLSLITSSLTPCSTTLLAVMLALA